MPKFFEPLERRRLFSTLPAGFAETQVANLNTDVAATMAFAPDGRLFVGDTDRGQIRIVKDNKLLATPALSLSVDHASERGINGIAFAPSFVSAPAGQKYVFIYYTRPDPAKPHQAPSNAKNRLSRFTVDTANADKLNPASELVLVDNISATAGNHNGGALHFGADGMLYLAVGEAAVRDDAQRLSNYNGKVLRINAMNPGNLVPADNPFVGQSGALPLIWAYGFRNPFTGAMKPGTNTLYINDVGERTWEEINHVKKGLNYGWPGSEGVTDTAGHEDPIFAYHHNGRGIAVTGGAFYNGNSFPAAYHGKYFFGDYVLQTIWTLDEAGDKQVPFATNTLMVLDIDVNPTDGSLWYLGLNGQVQRIGYSTGNRAPTAVAAADKTSGATPLTVTFNGNGSSDPDGDALAYAWKFGDGTTATGKTVTHTYNSAGKFTATLTVTDARGASDLSNALVIQAGNVAPTPKIESPLANSLYNGGQVISFKGSATDPEDGALAASRLSWSVMLHHDTHTHPFRTFSGVGSASFTIPKVGEVDANQWYRVTLTATDSAGLKKSTSLDIRPRKSTFTLKTNIAGLKLSLDSAAAQAAPFGTVGVVGMTRSISAPATQTLNGKTYEFVSWSDGKAAKHNIDVPQANTTYTATYREVATGTKTYTINPTADAYVRDGTSAAQNFGLATQLSAKNGNGGFTRHSYLKFGLKDLGSVTKATLRIWGRLDNSVVASVPVEIFAVASTSWTEGAITWNNSPAIGASIRKFTVTGTTAKYYEIDLTNYVKAQRAAGKTVVAFALRAASRAEPQVVFNSDEAGTNRPQLIATGSVLAASGSAAPRAATFSALPIGSAWNALPDDDDLT